jgi:hypothetical protein
MGQFTGVDFENESSLQNPDPEMNCAKHVEEVTCSDVQIRSAAAEG